MNPVCAAVSRAEFYYYLSGPALVLAAVFAGYLAWRAYSHDRKALGCELSNRLYERFNSEEMKVLRRRAMEYTPETTNERVKVALEQILDLLHQVAMYTRNSAIHEDVTWSLFSYYMGGYYEFSKAFVLQKEKDEGTTYLSHFKKWHKRSLALDKKKKTASPKGDKLQLFIMRESAI